MKLLKLLFRTALNYTIWCGFTTTCSIKFVITRISHTPKSESTITSGRVFYSSLPYMNIILTSPFISNQLDSQWCNKHFDLRVCSLALSLLPHPRPMHSRCVSTAFEFHLILKIMQRRMSWFKHFRTLSRQRKGTPPHKHLTKNLNQK